ncbi:hypothetical protein V6N13_098163 [Hibiscus sabdariffa]
MELKSLILLSKTLSPESCSCLVEVEATLNLNAMNQSPNPSHDAAVAYGYNNIPKRKLSSLEPLPLNQLSDLIRSEVVHTSLMSGMLKIVGHNKYHPKPIKIYKMGEVLLLDEKKDVGASNHRLLGALYCKPRSFTKEGALNKHVDEQSSSCTIPSANFRSNVTLDYNIV